jgi:hypothetical protein
VKRDEQDVIGKWSTPAYTLTQDAIAEIRGIDDDNELVDFAAKKI